MKTLEGSRGESMAATPARELRHWAAECRALADASIRQLDKGRWLQLAEAWEGLADRAEQADRVAASIAQPKPPGENTPT
jgi:hypothetical protein